MHKTNLQLVGDFHEKMGLPNPAFFSIFSSLKKQGRTKLLKTLKLRKKLILEEHREVQKELNQLLSGESNSAVALMKELADLLYVVYGAAVELGVDLDDVFLQVHKDNLAKLWPDGKPRFDEDGKVRKPDTYVHPNISIGVIAYHQENLQEREGI